jgi:hypothetical protein
MVLKEMFRLQKVLTLLAVYPCPTAHLDTNIIIILHLTEDVAPSCIINELTNYYRLV